MKHIVFLFIRLLLLLVALYAISNALKELLQQEDDILDVIFLISFNVLIAITCWSLGCRLRKPTVRTVIRTKT